MLCNDTADNSVVSHVPSLSEQYEGSQTLVIPSSPDKKAQQRVLAAIANDEQRIADDELAREWPITCQIKIDTSQEPYWILTSFDVRGSAKVVGGDEYYITYTAITKQGDFEQQPYSAVALVDDQNDGTYRLDFSATPTAPVLETDLGGTLTVYFQYSCGIGRMAPPSKQSWTNGAFTHTRYDIYLAKGPTIRPFQNPNTTMNFPTTINTDTSDSVCRETNATITNNNPTTIDLSKFDLILCLGDSTVEQFIRQRPNQKGKYMFQNNLCYLEKITFGLNTRTVSSFLDVLEQCSGHYLRNGTKFPSRAVMLGSCLWDILDSKDTVQGPNYDNHRQACLEYIRQVRKRYPDVTILWKSPTAVHIHVVDMDRLVSSQLGEAALFGIERLRYMSASRSRTIYDIQKQIIRDQEKDDDNILFLDLYDATYLSADWLFPSDGRHYRPDLNRLMLQWFYPSKEEEEKDDFKSGGILNEDNQLNLSVVSDGKGGKLLDIPKPYFLDPTYCPS